MRLFQKRIDKGCFSMVDVRDNGNVSDVCSLHMLLITNPATYLRITNVNTNLRSTFNFIRRFVDRFVIRNASQ